MKNLLFCLFLLAYLETNAQGFSVELEGGATLSINRFIYTSDVSPYFRQFFAPGPSMGISVSKFSKKETATSYFSLYFGTNGKLVAAIVKKGESSFLTQTGNGNPNLALRWNYYGRNKRPYGSGLMLGVNVEYNFNTYPHFPKGVGSPGSGISRKAIYLDNVVQFKSINPGLQVGVFKGLKLKEHAYLRFALYSNIGLKTTSYWYYRAVIDGSEYTAVIKSKGDFINFSVGYGYWHKKK